MMNAIQPLIERFLVDADFRDRLTTAPDAAEHRRVLAAAGFQHVSFTPAEMNAEVVRMKLAAGALLVDPESAIAPPDHERTQARSTSRLADLGAKVADYAWLV